MFRMYSQMMLPLSTLLLLSLSACSLLSGSLFASEESKSKEIVEADIEVAKEPPVKLEIAQVFFRDGQLNVKVYLYPKTDIEPEEVLVGLKGLSNGDVVEQSFQRLSEVPNVPSLDAGERIALNFSIPDSDLTEYQVLGAWGEDAKAESLPSPKSPSDAIAVPEREGESSSVDEQAEVADLPEVLMLRSLELESEEIPCERENCDLLYYVTGALENRSKSEVSEVILALGLYWKPEGASPSVPKDLEPLSANEEQIPLPDFSLAPGEDKKLRIAVERPVPQVPGGSFVPHLRILSSNPELP